MWEIISLQAQTSPYFQPKEKINYIEQKDKSETQLKTSPWNQKIWTKHLPISDK